MAHSHPYAIVTCDVCGKPVEDGAAHEVSGSGLLVFARGDDQVSYEEPPLCARCSLAIGVTAMVRWAEEEEEG